MKNRSPCRYFKASPEVIRLAVMMYVRFPLSLRNVEDLLHERGIDVSHETIRFWWQLYFNQTDRSGSPACLRSWHSTRREVCGWLTNTPQLLLAHHLKALRLPTFLREYDKVARQCASEGIDHSSYLLRLAELELIDRERRMVERRIKAAKFPAVKSLNSFNFKAIPSLNKMLVMELARCDYITRNENIIAVGNSGTGKTHIALGLGLAACQKGLAVGFITASALVHELLEARDEKRLLRLQKQLAKYSLLIIDELGYVPLSPTGAELLFEVFSQRYERGSTIVTSNLPFDEWTSTFGSERLTGALLDRLTHHVHILETVIASASNTAVAQTKPE